MQDWQGKRSEENGLNIIKCVNSHADLVEALQTIIGDLEHEGKVYPTSLYKAKLALEKGQ